MGHKSWLIAGGALLGLLLTLPAGSGFDWETLSAPFFAAGTRSEGTVPVRLLGKSGRLGHRTGHLRPSPATPLAEQALPEDGGLAPCPHLSPAFCAVLFSGQPHPSVRGRRRVLPSGHSRDDPLSASRMVYSEAAARAEQRPYGPAGPCSQASDDRVRPLCRRCGRSIARHGRSGHSGRKSSRETPGRWASPCSSCFCWGC